MRETILPCIIQSQQEKHRRQKITDTLTYALSSMPVADGEVVVPNIQIDDDTTEEEVRVTDYDGRRIIA